MFFLKKKSGGLKKNNIILIENFLDPVSKSDLISQNYKCYKFKAYRKNTIVKDILKCKKTFIKFSNFLKLDLKKNRKLNVNSKIISIVYARWFFLYFSRIATYYKILLQIKKKFPNSILVNVENYSLSEKDKLLLYRDDIFKVLNFLNNIGKYLKFEKLNVQVSDINKIIKQKNLVHNNLKDFNFINIIKFLFSKFTIILSKLIYKNTIYLEGDVLRASEILKLLYLSKLKFSFLFFLKKNNKIKNKHNLKIKFKFRNQNLLEKIIFYNFNNYVPSEIDQNLNYLETKTKAINTNIFKKDILISKRLFFVESNLQRFILENFSKLFIISYQHGGLYGQDKYYLPEIVEKMNSNLFASWGWKSRKTIQLPSHKVRMKSKKKYCLFVTMSPHGSFLNAINNFELIPDLLFKPSYQLLKKLSKQISTAVKLSNQPEDWRDREYFSSLKNIFFVNKNKDFLTVAPDAKFVVVNHFNTVALESIALNIPTLIFLNKELINFNVEAKKFLNVMLKNNIFFYDYKKLYNFLKKNNFDLNNWWFDPKIQDIRKKFCKNYNLTKYNFLNIWNYKLRNIDF